MKRNHYRRKLYGLAFAAAMLGCFANTAEAQTRYTFRSSDYVSTDNARAPQSAFSYDEAANTFSITAKGTNNVAFKMDEQYDDVYYINQDQCWFVVAATNVNNGTSDTQLWWINGYNSYGQSPQNTVKTADGKTLFLWNVKTNSKVNKTFDFTQPTQTIGSKGGMILAMGMTATDASKPSSISDVCYYAPYEAAAQYKELMSVMGYTAKSLTTVMRHKLDSIIGLAQKRYDSFAEAGAAKDSLKLAIDKAVTWEKSMSSTDYVGAYQQQQTLLTAMEYFRSNSHTTSFYKTRDGIGAKIDSLNLRVRFYADNMVRVVKNASKAYDYKSLVVNKDTTENVALTYDESTSEVSVSSPKMKVVFNRQSGNLTFYKADGTELIKETDCLFLPAKDGKDDTYSVTQTFGLEKDEPIYGMGQIQNGKLSLRGQSMSMVERNMSIFVPYFYSSKNYGIYWDNYSPTQFSDNASGTRFQSTGLAVDYYVMAANSSDEALANMRQLTGHCPMPPLWNFGLYQSKERYQSTAEVLGVVKKYRDLKVPLDCIVQDWQYWGGDENWNAMDFLNPKYANYQNMIDSVHKMNAKIMISVWANFGPNTKQYAELNALGRIIPVVSYPTDNKVHPYDVYGPTARDIYWKYLYRGILSKGIDALWMDSSEPDYFGNGTTDYDYVTETGRTWRALRNAFPLSHVCGVYDHYRAQTECLSKRSSILTRSGYAGMQRSGAYVWSGDVTASWNALALQIPAACNLSVCGLPYWNSDTGAFFTGSLSDDSWKRLYLRWTQFSTFTPMMRFHGTQRPREIYQFGSANDGVGYYDQILKYIKIRYRMLPYLYSTAHQVTANDRTFMRSLPIAFTDDKQGYNVNDEYMFGESFLVAPVVQDMATSRSVYLPSGHSWYDFWTGSNFNGGTNVTAKVNTDRIPLYIPAGTILPWGPDVQYSSEKKWDNLEIRVYPGADGKFVLYEDQNDGYDYEKGAYTEIPFTWNEQTQTLTIGARTGSFSGMMKKRTFKICRVSSSNGYGDEHVTRFDKTVQYDGSEVSVVLQGTTNVQAYSDCTDKITNPSFEADGKTLTQHAPMGWTVNCNTTWWGVNSATNISSTEDPVATDGSYIFGVWDAANNKTASISQELNNLSVGTYRLTVDMHASGKSGTVRVGNQRIFAGEQAGYFKDQVMTAGDQDNFPMQTIGVDFTVTNSSEPLKIGVTTDSAPSATWFKIDNFRLYKVDGTNTSVATLHQSEQTLPIFINGIRYNLKSNGNNGISIYTLSGNCLCRLPKVKNTTPHINLPKGIYIANTDKIAIQ